MPGRPVVVAAPGHSQGSVAFHLLGQGALLTGDVLMTRDPMIAGPDRAIVFADDTDKNHAAYDVLRSIDRALERRLRLACERGELQPAADVRARAALAASTLHSLAIRARAGESRPVLARIARAAVGAVARRDGL